MTTVTSKYYTTVEKALYQVFAAQGSIEESKLQILFQKLIEEPERFRNNEIIQQLESRTLEDSIQLINDRIKFIDEKISRISHQTERAKIYTLIRSSQDQTMTNQALISLPFTPNEIGAINRMVDTIITDNDSIEKFLLTGKEALRIVSSETSYTASTSERFLQRLVAEGVFIRSSQERFMLSNRTLSELQDHLINQYSLRKEGGLINKCIACKEIQTSGVRCPNLNCWVRLHKVCREPYFRAHGKVCSNCGTEWTDESTVFVGELAVQ